MGVFVRGDNGRNHPLPLDRGAVVRVRQTGCRSHSTGKKIYMNHKKLHFKSCTQYYYS